MAIDLKVGNSERLDQYRQQISALENQAHSGSRGKYQILEDVVSIMEAAAGLGKVSKQSRNAFHNAIVSAYGVLDKMDAPQAPAKRIDDKERRRGISPARRGSLVSRVNLSPPPHDVDDYKEEAPQLPERIDSLQDPHIFPKTKELVWDRKDAIKKAREATEYAKDQMMGQSSYVFPYPNLLEVNSPKDPGERRDFNIMARTLRDEDGKIDSQKFVSSRGSIVSIAYHKKSEVCSIATESKLDLRNGSKVEYKLYGFFEGWESSATARFAKEQVKTVFEKELIAMNPGRLTNAGIENALTSTFVHLDDWAKRERIEDGCSALVSVRIGDQLWTASAGDLRAVLFSTDGKDDNHVSQLSCEALLTEPPSEGEDSNPYNKAVLERGGELIKGKIDGRLPYGKGLNYADLKSRDPKYQRPYYVVDPCPDITRKTIHRGRHVELCLVSRDVCEEGVSAYDIASLLGSSADLDATREELANEISREACRIVRGTLMARHFRSDEENADAPINTKVMVVFLNG